MLSKTKVYCLCLIILCLIPASVCQDWPDVDTDGTKDFDAFEGGMLQHVYSGVIIAENTPIDFVNDHTLTKTIPQGIFLSTENVYVVVGKNFFIEGLSGLELENAPTDGDIHYIRVDKTQMTSGNQIFSLTLANYQDSPGNPITSYNKLIYNFIVIGSGFSGFSSDPLVESSYIYGKISKFQVVDNAQAEGRFDFADDVEGSPFDYMVSGSDGDGCGMIRKDGKIIIQEEKCDLKRYLTFIVGFRGETVASQPEFSIHAVNEFVDTSIGTAGGHFKDNPSDTEIGIEIEYNPTPLEFITRDIQLSFIFIGIREHSEASYPSQIIDKDNFFVYAKSASRTGQPGTLTTPLDLGIQTTDSYHNIKSFSHIFCGLDQLQIGDTDEEGSVFIANLVYDDGFGTSADILFSESTTALDRAALSCLLITKKDLCIMDDPLPTLSVLSFSTSSSSIDIDPLFSADLSTAIAISGFTQISPNVKFIFLPSTTEDMSVKIVLQYDRTSGDTAFQMSLGITDNLLSGDYLKITAFGQVIYEKYLTIGGTNFGSNFYFVSNDITQNTIIIQLSGPFSTRTSDADQLIRVGIASYDNVMNGIQCVNECPNQDGKQTGIDYSSTPPSCIYCDHSINQDYDHIQGQCKCMDRYTDDTSDDVLECDVPCDDNLCAVCTGPSGTQTCSECVPFAIDNAGCDCIDFYYENAGACLNCPNGCTTCESATDCDACVPNSGTRDDPSNGCQCLAGYYDDGESDVCPQCSIECKTCTQTSTKCTSCDTNGNFELIGTTCKCLDSFYELRNAGEISCEKCDTTCLTCEGSALQCTSCDEQNDFRQLSSQKTCECMDGFDEFMGECIDQSCSGVTDHCKKCAWDPMTSTQDCLECTENRIEVNDQCVCKIGFYEENDVCIACGEGCQKCAMQNNILTCQLCAINFETKNSDGTCSCPSNTILVQAAGTLYCRLCSSKCSSCSGSYDNCQSCKDPFVLDEVNNKCVCPPKTFITINDECIPCTSNCDKCVNSQSCDDCASGYVQSEGKCDLNCPAGTFKGADSCIDCPEGCSECKSAYQCTSCETDYSLYAGSCRIACPAGTFSSNQICYQCVHPCETCKDSADNCVTCLSTQVYFNGECLDSCPDGTFYGDGSCLLCNPKCLTCKGASTYCTSCPGNNYLYENNCFDECPKVIVNNKCVGKCPDGEYISENKECKPCDNKCFTCSGSSSNCLTCAGGFKSYNGDCVENCPSNYLEKETYCAPCDASCIGCSTTVLFCDQCAPGYIKIGDRCRSECPEGQYINYQTKSCEFCGTGCKACSSLVHCSECLNPLLTPYNGVCQKQCPVGAKLVGDVCICTFGFSFQNACVSSCPEGYYAYNKKCQICQSPCKGCISSASNCLSCVEGFKFDPATYSCVQITNCNFGEYEDNLGNCKRLCASDRYLHKTGCIPSCPNGFEKNGYGGCVAITNPSICQVNQFQQGSSCVTACQVGFYGNKITRVCEKCGQYCFLCLNKNHCLQCIPGYIPIDGICVPSLGCSTYEVQYNGQCLQGCPVGTYRDHYTCKPACKQGTYYYNGFCYQSCPTKAQTPEACVANCIGHTHCTQSP